MTLGQFHIETEGEASPVTHFERILTVILAFALLVQGAALAAIPS